jgi:hypothetical protein
MAKTQNIKKQQAKACETKNGMTLVSGRRRNKKQQTK